MFVKPSRPGSRVAEAYRLMEAANRAEKKAKKEPEPTPVKNAKPPRDLGGTT